MIDKKSRERTLNALGWRDAFTGAKITSTPEIDHKTPWTRLDGDLDIRSLTDDEINSFKETLVLSSIDSLSKLVLNNPLSVLFTSTVRRNNNRAKMNVEFDSWICTRCC